MLSTPLNTTARSREVAPRTSIRVATLLAGALACALVFSFGSGRAAALDVPENVGEWAPVVNWPTQGKHLILLPTNKVLVFPTGNEIQLWDIATNTFTPKPATFGDLHCAGHVTLADGSALVVGGVAASPFIGIKANAKFDPVTETWTQLALMRYARWYPTVTTLGDGRVLAASGTDETKSKVRIPEVYDPVTDSWTELTGAGNTQSLYPFMYQLPDGRVYYAAPKAATEFLDVSGAGSWTSGPTSGWDNQSGGCCTEAGAMYGIGKIIRSGGGDPAHARTGVIDMTAATPAWREVAPMAFPRRRHNTVILADGSIMAVGGTRASDDTTQAVLEGEIWNPATETWTTVASMSVPRMYHSAALLLPDGRVVAAGGDNPSATAKRTAQIYSPPYLFRGARPAITSGPSSATYGNAFTVGTDTSSIQSVALIRPGAPTHAIDMNQRYVPLTFTQSGTDLMVTAPASGNVAPPGAYMLVVENSSGVPSIARWIVIGSDGAIPPPPPLSAKFSASPTTGAAPLTVNFVDSSTGGPSTYSWDFENDGVVDATIPNPSHTYANPGSYTVKLTVANASGSDEEVKTGFVNVTSSSASVVRFAPVADARVQEGSLNTNYGTSYLRTDGATDPDVESYIRFNVDGLAGPVESAKLRVNATSGTSNGPAVYTAADNGWGESTIKWNNRPARSTIALADVAAVASGTWTEHDVTTAVSGNGTYTFVLATDTTDGLNMNSREASNLALRPELVISVATGPPPPPAPPVADFTALPRSGTAPLTVQFTDMSTGAEAWAWDFTNDDSFESTARSPQFTYDLPGTYTVRLQVENGAGGDEEIKTGYITVNAAPPPPPPGTTFTFTPIADAYVKSDFPAQNKGTSTQLRVDSSPAANSYLKFTVTGIGGPASSAVLRLYVVDPTSNAGSTFSVSNNWIESGTGGIVWTNAPLITGSPLSTGGAAPLNTWVEWDVTSAITGDGTFSFAVRGNVSDSAYFSSREGSQPPQLVVVRNGTSAISMFSALSLISQPRIGTTHVGAHHH